MGFWRWFVDQPAVPSLPGQTEQKAKRLVVVLSHGLMSSCVVSPELDTVLQLQNSGRQRWELRERRRRSGLTEEKRELDSESAPQTSARTDSGFATLCDAFARRFRRIDWTRCIVTNWSCHHNCTIATFLEQATEEQPPTPPLKWLTDKPVWVDQWPMTTERLQIALQLVAEQLAARHIRPSVSPWNTPIFVIPKKSGKWRLLHDLQQVNSQMQAMGALQPGLPSPVMLPQKWPLLIIDLKDCFFTIPLCTQDTPQFAFTVPSADKREAAKRFEWLVLPQGMKYSPTLCQTLCHWALKPVRRRFKDAIIYHYMDDI
ncbi:hypothetical protein DUI87_06695 [Hirundo rustica rustica]|uniref:ribonuclease H n=1 Tax=Hirundo rustica rustica TaxID=333673 RepID=A0A3M0KSV9_HIRRU|nr:hypothetical protein DUI87_06695 [Hirundo rustica rustica]